ncbi:Fcf2 pre-rRNA processing, partial [Dimargaris cristalligena]
PGRHEKGSSGPGWFNMKRPQLSESVLRDLQAIQYRGVLDTSRFYKLDKKRSLVPDHFQMGTIVEASHEFYSSRMTNKERKGTLTDQFLRTDGVREMLRTKTTKI